jgi:predicted DNA-binding transcriptional regulator AlpA
VIALVRKFLQFDVAQIIPQDNHTTPLHPKPKPAPSRAFAFLRLAFSFPLAWSHRMFMTRPQVARHFGVSNATIKSWSRNGKLPQPVKLPSGREAWPVEQIPGAVRPPSALVVDEQSLAASLVEQPAAA